MTALCALADPVIMVRKPLGFAREFDAGRPAIRAVHSVAWFVIVTTQISYDAKAITTTQFPQTRPMSFHTPDKPATLNLRLQRDADITLPLQFRESDTGPGINLTGYDFECELLASMDSDTPLLDVPVTPTDPEVGSISIAFTRTQTEDEAIMPVDHYWRLWWTDTLNRRRLVIAGRIRMEE